MNFFDRFSATHLNNTTKQHGTANALFQAQRGATAAQAWGDTMTRTTKILAAGCAANAHLGPHGMGLVGLSPDKQTAAYKLMDEHRAALFPLGLYAKRAELEALNASGAGADGKTKAVIRDITDIQAKMLTLNAEFRAKMFKATGLRLPVMGHGLMGGGMMMVQVGPMGPNGPAPPPAGDAPAHE
jgi:hypothetical protein